jgi:hypothetical protein
MEFGSEFSVKSTTKTNAGSEISWTNLAYNCTINTNDLFSQMLTIKIYDENRITAHTLIGSASVSLKGLANFLILGHNIDFPVEILCPKNKSVGKIIILCGIHEIKEKKDMIISAGFSRGVLHMNKILGKEIKGGGLFSSSIGELTTYIVLSVPLSAPPSAPPSLSIPDTHNDLSLTTLSPHSLTPSPSLTPSLAPDGVGLWTGKTGLRTGHTPVWEGLDFKPSVTRSSLSACIITAECWAKSLGGVGGDKALGYGTAPMISAGQCVC